MINIKYEGRQLYANVFERKDSPAIYHVNIIDDYMEVGRLTLHERDGKIIPDPEGTADPQIIKLVIDAIEKNPNRI